MRKHTAAAIEEEEERQLDKSKGHLDMMMMRKTKMSIRRSQQSVSENRAIINSSSVRGGKEGRKGHERVRNTSRTRGFQPQKILLFMAGPTET